MIFAREVSGPLTSLVKKIDEATGKNKSARMGSFVIFCSDAEGLEKQLKELVAKEKLQAIILAIDNPSGPPKYKVAKEADVTVVLYDKRKVKANHAYQKGQLTDTEIGKIVGEIDSVLLEKK